MNACFRDRREAGRILASHVQQFAGREDVIVLGLPRGGVPVAFEVARQLGMPLDVFIVRKLGMPGHEELAMGAIASGGVRVLNEDVVRYLARPERALQEATAEQTRELERREIEYRGGRDPPDLRGKTVIVVDDGLATGATMRVAVAALRRHAVARIVVAVPVSAPDTCAEIEAEADKVICLMTPAWFRAVGQFYLDFSQTTDGEVRDLLDRAAGEKEAK